MNEISKKTILLSALLLISISSLAYLPHIGSLGYYNDDWHLIASQTSGVSLFRMFQVDRPAIGLSYEVLGPLLGNEPLSWHLFAFAIRIIIGLLLLLILWMLWPKKALLSSALISLINIYPGFLHQPAALTYIHHLLTYAAALFSLSVTIFILKYKARFSIKAFLLLMSTIATLGYLSIIEYLIGFEAIRIYWVTMSSFRRMSPVSGNGSGDRSLSRYRTF